jgi:cell wall-associated NlpC family hydrolase
MLVRLFILIALLGSTAMPARATEQSFGEKIKKIFATPTATPRPRKKKHSSTAGNTHTSSETSRKKKKESAGAHKHAKAKHASSPSPTARPHHRKEAAPAPEPFETPQESQPPRIAPRPTATRSPAALKKRNALDATLTPDEIKGFENYPEKVRKLLASALELTARNLDYKYGSADPANGGMDCSGFVYFVLKENGIEDVPRDSAEQYTWLRQARTFQAVFSRKENSFELEDLKPGDLLFWEGTYSIERDPPITHAMIYLGREKKTGARIMVGASDGRVYDGKARYGVSVFDFKIHTSEKPKEGKPFPTFVGYGHIPELRGKQ